MNTTSFKDQLDRSKAMCSFNNRLFRLNNQNFQIFPKVKFFLNLNKVGRTHAVTVRAQS